MNDTVAIALAASAAPTLIALASLIASIRNGAKADVIAAHVNSAATASAAKIEALQREVADLRGTIADNKQIAAVLAANPTPVTAHADAPVEVKVVNPSTDPVPTKTVKP